MDVFFRRAEWKWVHDVLRNIYAFVCHVFACHLCRRTLIFSPKSKTGNMVGGLLFLKASSRDFQRTSRTGADYVWHSGLLDACLLPDPPSLPFIVTWVPPLCCAHGSGWLRRSNGHFGPMRLCGEEGAAQNKLSEQNPRPNTTQTIYPPCRTWEENRAKWGKFSIFKTTCFSKIKTTSARSLRQHQQRIKWQNVQDSEIAQKNIYWAVFFSSKNNNAQIKY